MGPGIRYSDLSPCRNLENIAINTRQAAEIQNRIIPIDRPSLESEMYIGRELKSLQLPANRAFSSRIWYSCFANSYHGYVRASLQDALILDASVLRPTDLYL